MEAPKVRLDGSFEHCECPCSLLGGWTMRPLRVPSNTNAA